MGYKHLITKEDRERGVFAIGFINFPGIGNTQNTYDMFVEPIISKIRKQMISECESLLPHNEYHLIEWKISKGKVSGTSNVLPLSAKRY